MVSSEYCQSCRVTEAEVIESCDDEKYPYTLCKPCHQRLLERSLRPLEYLNLAAKHGCKFITHSELSISRWIVS